MFSNLKYVYKILFCLLFFIFIFKNKKLRVFTFILLGLLLFFFRTNLSIRNYEDNIIISPSSSKVIDIKKENSIFTYLSPLDKHFMIAPIDCKVIGIEDNKMEKDSERKRIIFSDKNQKIFILELIVAKPFSGVGVFGGWLPKLFYDERVVVTCKKGEHLKRGQQFGLIRFGSNMQYYFPKSYNIIIKEKQHINIGDPIGFFNRT